MTDVPVNENDGVIIVVATSNGQAAFAYDFRVDDQDHLKAIFEDVSTGTFYNLLPVTHFTASGIGLANGGTITLTAPPVAVVIGDKLTIYRDVPIERLADYQQSGDYLAATVNAEQDQIYMILQQLRRDIARAIKSALGLPGLSIASGAVDTVPKFDASGNLIEGPSVAQILAAEQNATDAAASAAAAAGSEVAAALHLANTQALSVVFTAEQILITASPNTTRHLGALIDESGSNPRVRLMRSRFECTAADGTFAVGDVVEFTGSITGSAANTGISHYYDGSYHARIGTAGLPPVIGKAATGAGGASQSLDLTKWQWYFSLYLGPGLEVGPDT